MLRDTRDELLEFKSSAAAREADLAQQLELEMGNARRCAWACMLVVLRRGNARRCNWVYTLHRLASKAAVD